MPLPPTDGPPVDMDLVVGFFDLAGFARWAADRESRDAIISDMCKKGSAQLITRIGNVALIYRKNEDQPKIPVPL